MGLGESAGFVHIIDFGLAKMSRPLPTAIPPPVGPAEGTAVPGGYSAVPAMVGSTGHWC